jgi:hypothetical protein
VFTQNAACSIPYPEQTLVVVIKLAKDFVHPADVFIMLTEYERSQWMSAGQTYRTLGPHIYEQVHLLKLVGWLSSN